MWLYGSALLISGLSLALLGCSSSLGDYQCALDSECLRGEEIGRCEPDNHCSFPDPECESGFRYGAGAGGASSACTSDTGGFDAGGTPLPIARITRQSMPCDRTSAAFNAFESEAFGGASIASYQWSVKDPSGSMVENLLLADGETLAQDLHVHGGEADDVILNLTNYHDATGLRIVTDASEGSIVAQKEIELDRAGVSGNYRLFFAAASEVASAGLTNMSVVVRNRFGVALLEKTVELDRRLEGYSFPFTPDPAGAALDNSSIEFNFTESGTFWLDNVAVVDAEGGSSLSLNPSFESELAPWALSGLNGNDLLTVARFDPDLLVPGTYTIGLKITDSNGLESLPTTTDVPLQSCAN